MNRPFAYGDKVLLLDNKQRRYLITLAEGAEFHTHAGFIPHAEFIDKPEGIVMRSTRNAAYTALRPTLEDFVLEMPRGAQVIYPKDLAPICMLADIGPGMRVFESGLGSGALSMTMLRYGAYIVGYEIRDDFLTRARLNVKAFLGEEVLQHPEWLEAIPTSGDLDRLIGADEQKGLAIGFSHFRHSMKNKEFHLVGIPGRETYTMNTAPFDLPAVHIYKIWNGQSYDTESALSETFVRP